MQKTLFVAGGNGFIGQEICRTAIGAGHQVKALSRSGRPLVEEPWADMVTWIQGDALEPESWRDHLDGCDAAIHCIGIVREDPLQGETFERINAETATSLAAEANRYGVSTFVMISADIIPPMTSDRYLGTKRQAEAQIQDSFPEMRSVFLRPAIVYGRRRPVSILAGCALQVVNFLPPGLRPTSHIPLAVENVAATAVYAAVHPDVQGVVDEESIDDLAETAAGSLRIPPPEALSTWSLVAAAGAAAAVAGALVLRRK